MHRTTMWRKRKKLRHEYVTLVLDVWVRKHMRIKLTYWLAMAVGVYLLTLPVMVENQIYFIISTIAMVFSCTLWILHGFIGWILMMFDNSMARTLDALSRELDREEVDEKWLSE